MDTGIQKTEYSIPYLCKDGHLDVTGTSLDDSEGHGTNIAGLIARGIDIKKQCITVLKFYHTVENPSGNRTLDNTLRDSWAHIRKLNSKWVNMSFSGESYIREEYLTIKQLLKNGTKVVVAAGNEKKNLSVKCEVYPACYEFNIPGFYVVGAKDTEFSNFGGPVSIIEFGGWQRGYFGPLQSGTSQAAANWTAKLIKNQ
jgi:hypothetical protein